MSKAAQRTPEDEPVVFNAIREGINREEICEGIWMNLYTTTDAQEDSAVASETLDQVLAGLETSGIVLIYLCWHLSQPPEIQRHLREELLKLERPSQWDLMASGSLQMPDS
ncbi:hypothetical protein DCS_04259 [Drechmeria coniospora]|uniref:Uncharacterized protein n=1 Tax=Drechmeria coniospora TaxID=98403 RepID=A0A151GJR5_DRECN|nr:hypothetical protein DCS_04259 [Drechmeria coniospora]KYK57252.1 hypothetical protein DCS_04259 [Drechmeria coniospora]